MRLKAKAEREQRALELRLKAEADREEKAQAAREAAAKQSREGKAALSAQQATQNEKILRLVGEQGAGTRNALARALMQSQAASTRVFFQEFRGLVAHGGVGSQHYGPPLPLQLGPPPSQQQQLAPPVAAPAVAQAPAQQQPQQSYNAVDLQAAQAQAQHCQSEIPQQVQHCDWNLNFDQSRSGAEKRQRGQSSATVQLWRLRWCGLRS